MPRLSIIIPAFNEEKRLPKTLEHLRQYLSSAPFSSEVLVVDDGSTDGTRRLVQEMVKDSPGLRLLVNERNRGKGYSVRQGVEEAAGELVLFFDADASTPIDQVEKFFPHFQDGADVLIGSRSLPDSDVRVHQPWYRETMGRTFNLFVRLLVLRGFVDTQCGFKAFTREAALSIFARQRLSGFSFDVEILFIAGKLGYKITEVPIVWINSPSSRVHPIWDSVRMLVELMRIRMNDWRGFYTGGKKGP